MGTAKLVDRSATDEVELVQRARERASSLNEENRRTMPKSGTMRVQPALIPPTVRSLTMSHIGNVFEDNQGYEFDYRRAVRSFGYSQGTFPRRLVGALLIELSHRLHPGRRKEFLRSTCEILHRLEGTPRLFL